MIQWLEEININRDMSLSGRDVFEELYVSQIHLIISIHENITLIMRNHFYKVVDPDVMTLPQIFEKACFYRNGLQTVKDNISQFQPGCIPCDISELKSIASKGISSLLKQDSKLIDENTMSAIEESIPIIIKNINLIHDIFNLCLTSENDYRIKHDLPSLTISLLDSITQESIIASGDMFSEL